MRALVYVEGPADRGALEELLRPVIDEARSRRVGITFHPTKGKNRLLDEVPGKAATHLAEHPADVVFAIPDLYPAKTSGQGKHITAAELGTVMRGRFIAEIERRFLDPSCAARFRVHCFKYDLEALLLAVPDRLRAVLGTKDKLTGRWAARVEDQDHDRPPKRVVEELFLQYQKRRYRDVLDAPRILQGADLAQLETACPECFAPFVNDLRTLCHQ